MQELYFWLLLILPVAYTLVVVAHARVFLSQEPIGVGKLARSLLWITLALHCTLIGLRSALIGSCPLVQHWDFLALIAAMITLFYAFSRRRSSSIGEGAARVGVFVLAVPLCLQVLASGMSLSAGADAAPDRPLTIAQSTHGLCAVFGYSAVTLASIYGVLYLFLYGAIKGRRFGTYFQRMIDLETLGRLNFEAVVLAFASFCVTLPLEYLLPVQGQNLFWVRMVSGSAWLLYGLLVSARVFFGLGGKRFAYISIVGLILCVAMFGLGIQEGPIFG